MCTSCGIDSCDCKPIVVQTGQQGKQGIQGDTGWSPNLVLFQNDGTSTGTGNLYSLKFNGWVGGSGPTPTNPSGSNVWLQSNGTFGPLSTAANLRGATGATGPQGISLNSLGNFSSDPPNPNIDDFYYNTVAHVSYVWNGTVWNVLVKDGTNGTGTPGTNGISIVYLGSFNTPPGSPSLNQVYRNTSTTPAIAYLWNGSAWIETWQDGTNGTNGVNGFNYETVDGNNIPATATNRNQVLKRKQDNTGYEFAEISQIAAITNLINTTWH